MWIKLSGASKNLLNETGKFEEKESIKYARYGRLVVIPAILGGIAGAYAFSTILDNPYWCFFFGLLWFFIVLAVDMAMSATMYKSKRDSPIGFWVSVAFRILFSICVGVVISHPLILRIFEPSIEQNIKERDRAKKNQEVLSAKGNVDSASKYYLEKIDEKKSENECLGRLIQFETGISNTEAKEFFNSKSGKSCGWSSGYGKGCSSECVQRQRLRRENSEEITRLQTAMTNATKPTTNILNQAEANRVTPETKDYLARTEALELLANGDGKDSKGHTHVGAAATALIWFFVVLDCLIVIFKASTPMGAYEHANDVLLESHIKKLEAEKEGDRLYAETLATGKAKAKATQEIRFVEVLEAVNLVNAVVRESENSREEFRATKKKMLKRVSIFDLKRRKEIKKEIFEMEHLYDLAVARAREQLAGELKKERRAYEKT